MFKLAHISDVHLPLAGALPHELLSKRILGWLSWRLRRARAHRPEALERILRDIHAHGADHLAITGDLVNISTRGEFAAARQWLETLRGRMPPLTLVPGNHDFYVAGAAKGLASLAPWMAKGAMPGEMPEFPTVRYLGNVALIGLNSTHAAPWGEASGELGAAQLKRLGPLLRDCAAKGLCRVVLIHHPPLPELEPRKRKALRDAAELREVLRAHGAELVLFGHTHRWAHAPLRTQTGVAHVLSVPSASMAHGHKAPPAGWQLITVRRESGAWHFDVERRALNARLEMARHARLRLSSLMDAGGEGLACAS